MKNKTTMRLLRHFAKQVTSQRYQKHLTQHQLAEILDCHLNTISNFENGRYMPTLEMALKLSKVLNISLDEMVDLVLQELEV